MGWNFITKCPVGMRRNPKACQIANWTELTFRNETFQLRWQLLFPNSNTKNNGFYCSFQRDLISMAQCQIPKESEMSLQSYGGVAGFFFRHFSQKYLQNEAAKSPLGLFSLSLFSFLLSSIPASISCCRFFFLFFFIFSHIIIPFNAGLVLWSARSVPGLDLSCHTEQRNVAPWTSRFFHELTSADCF